MAISQSQAFLGSIAGSIFLTRFALQYAPYTYYFANFVVIYSLALSSLLLWNVILWPKFFSPLRHLPTPAGGTFLNGQMWRIMKEENGAPLRAFLEEVPNDGLIRYTHLMNKERVLIASPKALGEVLVTKNYEFIKPLTFRVGIGRLLGIGILFAEGDEHKRQRKLLMPAFSYRHIKDLYPTFWSKAREVTEAMTAEVQTKSETGEDKSIVETGGWASRVTLDIIGLAGMGHDFEAIKDPNSELNKCYRAIFQPSAAARVMQYIGMIIPMELVTRLPVRRNREIAEARQVVRRICFQLINQKKQRLDKGAVADKDILSVAIESGGFSDEDLVNQLMTFLAAGHETTASAMMWACYLLCKHPKIQQRLRDDIRAHLPPISDETQTVSAAEVDKCAYLQAVCNEVLRFFPSVPMTVRMAAHDTTILGHPIPKDTTIIISPWAINVNKELWGEDATEFNPERWMGPGRANTGGADSNYSFLTFIHGPRSCIGQNFAKAEFACLIAAWFGRFEMEFAEKDYKMTVGGGLTSKPKGGFKVRLNVVEGW